AACGCPVVMGPHTFNFLEASQQAQRAGAALRVDHMAAAVQAALQLVRDAPARQAASAQASALSQAHKGAARRVVGQVQALL
ncbi:MAG: 3-deoxy-D-manno-octulosonic acid transferase, partial [Limnohabitans sp.]